MITIEKVKTLNNERITLTAAHETTRLIDGSDLTVLPGLIDPHVHFRIPGQAHKEDWISGAKAALQGGYTTVMDMPNNIPACVTKQRLQDKIALIESQLITAKIPLRYHLYLGASAQHFDQISQTYQDVIGLKIFMGSSTGDLLMADSSSLHAAFSLAAQFRLLVAVHAECDCSIHCNEGKYSQEHHDFSIHSKIRDPEVAAKAVSEAISLARLYKTRLYLLHVSSQAELTLIKQAKESGLPIYAEACPHHLFLDTRAYHNLGSKAQMNPPLRENSDCEALWQAVKEAVIDTIASDHAPHTLSEKALPYGQAPSGVPGIETTLPLLLTAVHQDRLTLNDIVRLCHDNPQKIFHLTPQDDCVLVNTTLTRRLSETDLYTKCAWSPYAGWELTGWPQYVILRNQFFDLQAI